MGLHIIFHNFKIYRSLHYLKYESHNTQDFDVWDSILGKGIHQYITKNIVPLYIGLDLADTHHGTE